MTPENGYHHTGRRAAPITPREHEVLALVAAGLTNRQIALQLDISWRTVQTYVSRLFAKLAVSSRTQLAVLALDRGWVDMADAVSGVEAQRRPF